MPTIQLSQQTYNEFERLKTIMAQLLNTDTVEDDQVIWSLIGWFLESLNHERTGPTQNPHKQWWCCGWTCHTHNKEDCC